MPASSRARLLYEEKRSQTRTTVSLTEPNSFIATSALREGSMWK